MRIVFILLMTAAALSGGMRAGAQDAGPAAPPSTPPLTAEAGFFYDQLAPYGQWLWVSPHGWVWAPDNVAPGWRPYSEGRWVYTECGWTWSSDDPWGWAPFHYGRWFFEPARGWCWVPGSEWAPAWVSWQWGENGCGWAPIPPLVAWETCSDWGAVIPGFAWCFVAHADFCRPQLREYIVLAAQNVTWLRVTRNITRFERRDSRLVNLSLSAEQVQAVVGRPVPRFRIAESDSPVAGHVSLRGKTEINFYRPVVSATRGQTPSRHDFVPDSPRRPELTFDQLRRDEMARQTLEREQVRERERLERQHQSELRRPPPGASPRELQERHQAEHGAFNEHVRRQNQVFENRQQFSPPARNAPAPNPPAPGRGYHDGR